MNSQKLVIIVFAFLIISGASLGLALFFFSDTAIVNVHLDGENVTVTSLSIPSGVDTKAMENEIREYTYREMNTVESNLTTLKSGISVIAGRHFKNVEVNIESQFGKDQIPMLIKVTGTSMLPTIQDGERLILLKTQDVEVGDLVAVIDPEYGGLMKRIGKIEGDKVFLSSDNSGSPAYIENGTFQHMVSVEKWTDKSNIVGVAKIRNIWRDIDCYGS